MLRIRQYKQWRVSGPFDDIKPVNRQTGEI
jgi:hypothetical protein